MNQRISIAAGTAHILSSPSPALSLPFPLTLTARPGSGGTLNVEFQTVFGGDWSAWDHGAVTASVTDLMMGPVYALRFTAATQPAVMEIAQ